MDIDTITTTIVGNAREESCSTKRLLLQPFFMPACRALQSHNPEQS